MRGLTGILLAEIKAARLPAPILEHRFAAPRRWRFDLCWPDRLVAVEIHGSVWVRGRHTRGAGFEADREKMNAAQLLGWRVLEYSTGQVKAGRVVPDLRRVLF